MVYDFSEYVEVFAKEASATAFPYVASTDDVTQLKERHVLNAIDDSQLVNTIKYRLKLFDDIENNTIPEKDRSVKRVHSDWLGTVCYICKEKTITKEFDNKAKIRYCPNCGWWESEKDVYINQYGKSMYEYEVFTVLRRAVLKQFQLFSDEVPLDSLITYIKKNPNEINKISPKKLELLVKSVFEEYFNCEVIHVGGPQDGGYDLVLVLNETPILIQVKQHYDPQKIEPVSYIREFIGAMTLENSKNGIFVTTASRFSRPSQEAVKRVQSIHQMNIELYDSSKIKDVLKLVKNENDSWKQKGISFREYSYEELSTPYTVFHPILTMENPKSLELPYTNISTDLIINSWTKSAVQEYMKSKGFPEDIIAEIDNLWKKEL